MVSCIKSETKTMRRGLAKFSGKVFQGTSDRAILAGGGSNTTPRDVIKPASVSVPMIKTATSMAHGASTSNSEQRQSTSPDEDESVSLCVYRAGAVVTDIV